MRIVTKAEEATGQWWAIVPWYAYVILALAAGCAIQTIRLGHSEKSVDTLKASVATFAITQKTNLSEISDLQKANAEWKSKFADEVANSKTYLEAANEYASEQTQKATKAQKSLDAIYAHSPSDKAWSVAKPSLSIGVQLRANSGSSAN